jgi:hypothetical protein
MSLQLSLTFMRGFDDSTGIDFLLLLIIRLTFAPSRFLTVYSCSLGGISVGGLILITVLLQFYVPSFIYLRWEALPGLCQVILSWL